MTQRFDLQSAQMIGEPTTIADPVGSVVNGMAGFTVSGASRIAYRGGTGPLRELKWYDRSGTPTKTVLDPEASTLLYPELSPGGERVAVQRTIQGNTDLWIIDMPRGSTTRFTFDSAIDLTPVWSPDGSRIVFASSRKGPYNLYVKASSGTGTDESLLETSSNKYPQDWSRDGRIHGLS